MRSRWATRTSELFWTHPVLWIPVFLASILSLLVRQLQGLLTSRLLVAFLWHKDSVFSTATSPPSRTAHTLMQASLIGAPIYWAALFVCAVLYVAAFLLTATHVHTLLRRPLRDGSTVSSLLQSRLGPILRCAAILWGLYALEALLSTLAANGLNIFAGKASLQYWVYLALALNAVLAFVAAPFAFGFLERCGFGEASPRALRQGRLFAILAALLSPLLGLLYSRATMSLHASGGGAVAIVAAGSLLTVIPYILLMIFFAVAIEERSPVEEEEEATPPAP